MKRLCQGFHRNSALRRESCQIELPVMDMLKFLAKLQKQKRLVQTVCSQLAEFCKWIPDQRCPTQAQGRWTTRLSCMSPITEKWLESMGCGGKATCTRPAQEFHYRLLGHPLRIEFHRGIHVLLIYGSTVNLPLGCTWH